MAIATAEPRWANLATFSPNQVFWGGTGDCPNSLGVNNCAKLTSAIIFISNFYSIS
jgi:hypothetical protein